MINSPSKPTGWIMPRENMVWLRDFGREHDIWIVADEVYWHFTFGDTIAPLCLEICLPTDPLLITNTFSKNGCMIGGRMGWVIFPQGMSVIVCKATTAISGPHDDIELPEGAVKTDWEVELAVVIGAPAWRVSAADALSVVAGYCICNDVSERSFQLEHGGQWIKGKSAPTFGPLGPWLVTADEIPDVQHLRLTLDHNGIRRQDGTTARMIFPVAQIITYLTRFMRLMPGDVITTGTPAGVGLGMSPQVFLRPGDMLELEISGLGRQRQRVRGFTA